MADLDIILISTEIVMVLMMIIQTILRSLLLDIPKMDIWELGHGLCYPKKYI